MPAKPQLDSPVRTLLDIVSDLSGSGAPALERVGRELATFARDLEYLQHHIDSLDPGRFGQRVLANTGPDGPFLQLVHRPEGMMGAIHSHAVWVALAPITGTETHRHYAIDERKPDGSARLSLTEERHLDADLHEFATLTPPDDVHAHGHVPGIGSAAYILVLTGKPQVQFERQEYDAVRGAWRTLAPGDMGSPGQAL
jgi:predicted metal-dependent enzyme (double-stranded beta helix superfamily)